MCTAPWEICTLSSSPRSRQPGQRAAPSQREGCMLIPLLAHTSPGPGEHRGGKPPAGESGAKAFPQGWLVPPLGQKARKTSFLPPPENFPSLLQIPQELGQRSAERSQQGQGAEDGEGRWRGGRAGVAHGGGVLKAEAPGKGRGTHLASLQSPGPSVPNPWPPPSARLYWLC